MSKHVDRLIDFVLRFDHSCDLKAACSMASDRPGLEMHPPCIISTALGRALIQPRDSVHPSTGNETRILVLGNPLGDFNGQITRDADLLAHHLGDLTNVGAPLALSGLFAFIRIGDTGCTICTDRMGFQPIYYAVNSLSQIIAIGSNVDLLAAATNNALDVDETSLAELLAFGTITFPYTTRTTIRECEPGSIIHLDQESRQCCSTPYWVPEESDLQLSGVDAANAIYDAVRVACDQCTRGFSRVGIQLSAGRDSRAILAATPRERVAGAVTFATRLNREIRIAQLVAAAANVPHDLAQRDPEWYSSLYLDRGTRLAGTELKSSIHGLIIYERGFTSAFDIVLNGLLSDTLLKAHYMPRSESNKWVREPRINLRRCARDFLKRLTRLPRPNVDDTCDARHLQLRFIRRDLADAVEHRRRARLDTVKTIRPLSASEWAWFWPASRQDDFAQMIGESKLMVMDGVFMHKKVVDVACNLHPSAIIGGTASRVAFTRLYSEAGLPEIGTEQIREVDPAPRSSEDIWNEVEGSWVNREQLQMFSPLWITARQQVSTTHAADIVRSVLSRPWLDPFIRYQRPYGQLFNLTAMQVAAHLSRLPYGC